MTLPLRVLVVDDEPAGRRRLVSLLRDEPGVELVGTCEDGADAVERLRTGGIDLVLLDVQMPGYSGLEVVREVGPRHMPPVIFVTAYDEHAIEAFEVHALDYLLKPFAAERLRQALDRARAEHDLRATGALRARLGELLSGGGDPADRLVLRTGGRVLALPVEEIERIEAAGNYLRVFLGNEEHLVRCTLKAMEERLGPAGFLRVHRSTLVNGARVRAVVPDGDGETSVVLRDGRRVRAGRRYRAAIEAYLGRA